MTKEQRKELERVIYSLNGEPFNKVKNPITMDEVLKKVEKKGFDKVLKTLNKKRIVKAVKSFNNSPWISYGTPYDLKETLKRAKREGYDVVLKKIDDADKYLFHKEEAACSCI